MSYTLTSSDTVVVRDADGAFIPIHDEGNADCREFLAWLAAGNTPSPYVAPRSVPDQISDRQFFQQLAISGIISQAEALAAVRTGDIPQAMLALVAQLPADAQFDAEIKLSGATTFYRRDPLTIQFGSAYGWSSDQIDAFFIAAAAL